MLSYIICWTYLTVFNRWGLA